MRRGQAETHSERTRLLIQMHREKNMLQKVQRSTLLLVSPVASASTSQPIIPGSVSEIGASSGS